LIFVEKLQKIKQFCGKYGSEPLLELYEGTSINKRAALIVLFRLQTIKIHCTLYNPFSKLATNFKKIKIKYKCKVRIRIRIRIFIFLLPQ
jgi:hypothetical protein